MGLSTWSISVLTLLIIFACDSPCDISKFSVVLWEYILFLEVHHETVNSEDETVNSEVLVAPSNLPSVIPSRGPSV